MNPASDSLKADAGGPYNLVLGRPVSLDGSGSTGPEGMAYEWKVTPVPPTDGQVDLASARAPATRVIVTDAGGYEVKLEVSASGAKDSATTTLSG